MGQKNAQRSNAELWSLVRRQHGVLARPQLLELGFNSDAIQHRLTYGRLRTVWPGVYAVGRPALTQHGRWMAAVLAGGPHAVLSHLAAGTLWEIQRARSNRIDISVPLPAHPRCRDVVLHRRAAFSQNDVTEKNGIPVTTPICTLIDLATCLDRDRLESAINEADKLDLVTPDELRLALDETPRRPGLGVLRALLDRRTFVLTDSRLERYFLPIVRKVGLTQPLTRTYVNGHKVDFFWPDLGLVVETDGLRYHRTPAQQAQDRVRDQTHTAAGLTPLRFTHAQVRFEQQHVEATLAAVAQRLLR